MTHFEISLSLPRNILQEGKLPFEVTEQAYTKSVVWWTSHGFQYFVKSNKNYDA